jgi:hypothetical protein
LKDENTLGHTKSDKRKQVERMEEDRLTRKKNASSVSFLTIHLGGNSQFARGKKESANGSKQRNLVDNEGALA